ncbi:protease pro-enzyme activation domain-containing protein [Acidicapsa dinghuensis]|uniref:Protease pro-enzyme activation domain-containing protein n=1 Tax=Acidicapsa dinghuensis TaxID=2218256 RepID=A0ABW1EPY0_9BACT|nr:protease pro-enzyme activation domain-containing protein [Acidicapsa dinghuensis]
MPRFVPLPGSIRVPLPHSRPAGPVDRSQMASITVRVRSAAPLAELEDYIRTESAMPLAQRTYLSREELASRYGAGPDDLTRIEQYAACHNLYVVSRSAAKRSIVLQGTLGDLLRAFPAKVSLYHHSLGSYRGRIGAIQIPEELETVVTGIFGYDTRPKRRLVFGNRVSAAGGPGGDNGQPASFFANRYNFPKDFQGTLLDGTGQNIAIIELGGGFQTSDLEAYFNEIGSPVPSVAFISVDCATNNPGEDRNSDGEVMLDIEVVGTVAPKANVFVYFAPNTDQGFIDAISAAVHDTERQIDVISISWGSPEPDLMANPDEKQELDAYDQAFQAAAAVGITVCVATGDHGTADEEQWDGKIHVDHPACNPRVIACGGTQIDAASGNDVAWNEGTGSDPSATNGIGWAGGGGISKCFSVPSYKRMPICLVRSMVATQGVARLTSP